MTFKMSCQHTEDDLVTAKPLTGVTLTSQIRDGGNFVATLVITITNSAAGQFLVEFPTSTLNWPIGLLYWDVRILINGIYTATRTKVFEVERAPTQI